MALVYLEMALNDPIKYRSKREWSYLFSSNNVNDSIASCWKQIKNNVNEYVY